MILNQFKIPVKGIDYLKNSKRFNLRIEIVSNSIKSQIRELLIDLNLFNKQIGVLINHNELIKFCPF